MTGLATWASWHLHLASTARGRHDRALLEVVGPTVGSVPGRPWFFIRYWQAGPHLRVRVGDLDPDERARVEQSLRHRFALTSEGVAGEEEIAPDTYRAQATRLAAVGESAGPLAVAQLLPAGVHRAEYEPEVERYGGPAVLAESERLFHLSSELVLGFLRSEPSTGARMALAVRTTWCAAATLGGPAEQRAFYRRGAQVSRSLALAYGYSVDDVGRLDRAVRDAVRSSRRPSATGSGPGPAPRPADGPIGRWSTGVAGLVRTLRRGTPAEPESVIGSHVHMFHNRLGLTTFDELQTYLRLGYLYSPAEMENPR